MTIHVGMSGARPGSLVSVVVNAIGGIMKYFLLGRSGLRVSELCLGTMTFGEAWGWGASKRESRIVHHRQPKA